MSHSRWTGFYRNCPPIHSPFLFRLKSPFHLTPFSLGSPLLSPHTLVSVTLHQLFHSLFCMPVPQPPYPSFTLVMSSAPFAANDNMRLPAYRASHLARFHPYPRSRPSHHERLLTTIDRRFSELSEGPIAGAAPSTSTAIPKDKRKAENNSEAESNLKRQKLKTAAGRLSAVIVTLRRMYRGTSVKQAEQKLKFELMN